MRGELQRVLMLQPSWSPARSPEMDERGTLVRDAIPRWLASHRSALAAAVGVPLDDLLVEGRDGAGAKTRVPWCRFASRSHSPSATRGFYVVLLFDAHGEAVYLSLNQGTADYAGGDFRRKPDHVVRARAEWARSAAASWLTARTDVTQLALHDRRRGLGDGYELGDVASIRYSDGAVPGESTLLADVLSFAEGLRAVYAAERRAPLPFEAPEVELVVEVAEAAAGKPRPVKGAGFRTDAEETRIVERHAVSKVREHYEQLGWTVRELGKPFDLELRRDGERIDVEVKGTTSDGAIVTLTDGEVRHHNGAFPDNALVVVSRIVLDRSGPEPRATGGRLKEIRPWRIEPSHLRPIAHRYAVPEGAATRPDVAAS